MLILSAAGLLFPTTQASTQDFGIPPVILEQARALSAVGGVEPIAIQQPAKSCLKSGIVRMGVLESLLPESHASAVIELDLAQLLNRHLWTTRLILSMGGQDVFISGGFDRRLQPFLAVYTKERPIPRILPLCDLKNESRTVFLGNVAYEITLWPNWFNRIASLLEFNIPSLRDQSQYVRISRFLDAAYASGQDVSLSGVNYKVFFFEDFHGDAGVSMAGPALKTLAFASIERGQPRSTLIPSEAIPTDRIAVFRLHNNAAAALQIVDQKLRVHDAIP